MTGFLLVGLLSIACLLTARRSLQRDAQRELSTLSQLQVARVDEQVSALHERASNVATDPALVALSRASRGAPTPDLTRSVQTFLSSVVERSDVLASATLCALSGEHIADSGDVGGAVLPPEVPPEFRMDAKRRIEQGERIVTSAAFQSTDGRGRYFDAIAIRSVEGQLLTVLFAEIRMDRIDAVMPVYTGDRITLDTHLVQRDGETAQIVTDLRFSPNSRFRTRLPLTKADAPAVRAAMGYRGLLGNTVDYRNERVIAWVQPLSNAPWSLVIKMDQHEAYGMLRYIGGVLAILLLSVMALLTAGYLFMARVITGRIQRLMASASAISDGAFHARVGDPSADELGELGRAFDRMADTLAVDIARRERVEAELAHRALHDPLTDLPNRSLFAEHLRHGIDRRRLNGGELAVLFVDLDAFKSVNDELGHTAGDRLLRSVADRFRKVVTPNETLARFGGDEFVVLCRGLDTVDGAGDVADRLLASLAEPVRVSNMDVFVTASIGIAIVDDTATPESLVRDADAAMYRAKSQGRGRRVTHDAGIRAASTHLTNHADLRRAVDTGAFAMVYQPIVDLDTGVTFGYEALARWPREDGVAMPEEFLPLISELDLAPAFDRWAFTTACGAIPHLRSAPGSPICISVNISTPALLQPGFADLIQREAANLYGTDRSICLEITEHEMGDISDAALDVIIRLRAAGIRFAVDDFGTRGSSLSRLRQLPVDVVKIDKSFVNDIHDDSSARAVVHAVITLGAELGLRVVAEGIENNEQLIVLRQLGCDGGQGYLFGRPAMLPPLASSIGNAPTS